MDDEKSLRTQWHGPFCDAMQLELKDEKGLEFQREVPLNTKPIILDLLIIKKSKDVSIKNDIGKIFRGHNILEYKSPGDSMGVDVYFKVLAYASLYKCNIGKEDEIRAEDITISLVREQSPDKLMGWMKNRGYIIKEHASGIYEVEGAPLFRTQILVTGEMENVEHIWLRALTRDVSVGLLQDVVDRAESLKKNKVEKHTDSIVYLVFDELRRQRREREVDDMYEKTMSLFKDRIDKMIDDAVKEKDKEISKKNDEIKALKERIAALEKV